MFLGHLPAQEATDGKPFPPSADEEMALDTTPIASEIFDEPAIPYESLTDDHSAARSSGSDTNRSEPTQETEESGRSFDALEAASTSRIHRRDLEQARVNRRSRANKATKAGSYKKPRTPELDLSLVLGMERTLFAALNNAWLLALGGVGLMSVGNGDRRATNGGIVILMGGIISAIVAFIMHAVRISELKTQKTSQLSHSIVWATLIASLTLSTLGLELYFGIMYPYLQREKEVTIVGGVDGL